MTVIYPVPEMLPDPRARFIQIVNTCYALAKIGIEVIIIAGIKKGYSRENILGFYGIPEHQNLKIICMPVIRGEQKKHFRFSWHGVFHFSLLGYLLLHKKIYKESNTILFLRYIKLADFILRFKRLLKLPVVFEVHEIFNVSILNKRKKDKIRRLENMIYNKCDTIIAISEAIKRYLANMGIPEASVHVIQNGIRPEWFELVRRQGSYICYTGSFYKWKGVDILIKAMGFLPDEELLIVGGGHRLEELKDLAKAERVSEQVVFTGPVRHASVPQYLSKAKIAVLPNIIRSPSEFSSPLKLFEYMACGIPVVASDIPVIREILVDGENAVLFESGNPKALAAGIKKITDNPELAEKIAYNAQSDARNYTYEKRAEKISEVIKYLRTEFR